MRVLPELLTISGSSFPRPGLAKRVDLPVKFLKSAWILLVAFSTLSFAATAEARVRTCVTVEASSDERALARLVRTELNRHTTHVFAENDCEARLQVELVVVGASAGGGRHLTGWLDGEVPYRVDIDEGGLARAVEELLGVLLHNDPRRLRGPEAEKDVFGHGMRALRVSGQTYFGFEAYQLGTFVNGSLQTLPGLAAVVRREVGQVHVGARVAGAHAVGDRATLTLKTDIAFQLEAAWFTSATADTAAFVAVVLGYELQGFEGPASDGTRGTAFASGFSPGMRAGVELFRVTRARAELFVQGVLPTFVSKDGDSGVVDQWTPTIALGAGVLF